MCVPHSQSAVGFGFEGPAGHYAALAPLTPEQQREQRAAMYQIYETYPPHLASVSEAVDHIDHVVRLVGIDHVGIGTDFDGGGQLADCKNAAQLKNITIELLRRGYSEEDIEKIWSGNLLRVMQAAQDYAAHQTAATRDLVCWLKPYKETHLCKVRLFFIDDLMRAERHSSEPWGDSWSSTAMDCL